MQGLVDSHCHLDFKHFDKDRAEVIERARSSGIELMINSGVDLATNRKTLELARNHDFIRPTLGLSPNGLERLKPADVKMVLDHIQEHASEIVGVGEAGLDYYRCVEPSLRRRQVEVFSQVIELARSLDLPLIIHARDTEEEAFGMVKDLDKVIFHCYSGNLDTMKKIVDRGFYVSIATVVCRSVSHQAVAKQVPLERLLIETDSPFLSPRRGRNEPSFVLDSVRLISRLRGIDPAELARATGDNARRIFGL